MKLVGKVYVDSSAAIGVAHRRGNGKMRHVRVGTLWIQEKVESREIEVRKIKGEQNPADVLTKNVNKEKVERFTKAVNQEWKKGKAEKGLETAKDAQELKTSK